MKKIILFLVIIVLITGISSAQMQNAPITESGESIVWSNLLNHVAFDGDADTFGGEAPAAYSKTDNGTSTNLAMTGSTESVDATNGTEVVNWRTLTNHLIWGNTGGTLSNQTDLNTELTNRYTKAEVDGIVQPYYIEGWATNGTITLTNQSQYYAWTTWIPGESTSGFIWTNNGVQIGTTDAAGMYEIKGNLSVSLSSNGEELEAVIWKGVNGVVTNEIEKLSGHTYMATSGRPYPIPVGGYYRLELNDYVELRFSDDTGAGRVVDASDGVINFRMQRIGD